MMFNLLKNTECFIPEYIGKKDILLVLDKIAGIQEKIEPDVFPGITVYDCSCKIACPGFIDQHIHLTGGGGEDGPQSSISEIMLCDIISAGVSTVVGVLGVDGVGKNVQGLLTKARSLEFEGINSYIYSGHYGMPSVTLTGRVLTDIAFIDKIIGAGEIAISDYRSSHPSLQALKELASEVMTGGMLGGKAGVMHMHVGDGKRGLLPLFELLRDSDFPAGMFVPTHLNRNKALFEQAFDYARKGGNIDLTAGEKTGKGYSVADSLIKLLDGGISIDRITISSDGNGSMKIDGSHAKTAVGKVSWLLDDIRECIGKGIAAETVLKTVTSNVAKLLKLYPAKGTLALWSDADILILNREEFTVDKLFVRGKVLIDNGILLKKGKF
jgi:beta-aspartyl-dipeptidase (metallo-type)